MALREGSLPRPRLERPARVLIVLAPFYRDIADALLEGARATLDDAGAAHETVEVPGALEIPTAIRLATIWPVKTPSTPKPASTNATGSREVSRLVEFSRLTSWPIRRDAWSAITTQPGTTAQNPWTR